LLQFIIDGDDIESIKFINSKNQSTKYAQEIINKIRKEFDVGGDLKVNSYGFEITTNEVVIYIKLSSDDIIKYFKFSFDKKSKKLQDFGEN